MNNCDFTNDVYDISFFSEDNKNYMKKNNVVIEIDTTNVFLISRQYFTKIDKELPFLKIRKDSFFKNTYLLIDDDCFYLAFIYENIFYVLEKLSFSDASYIEFHTVSTHSYILFGDKETYFYSFLLDTFDSPLERLQFFSFYQLFLQKKHLFLLEKGLF